MTINCTPGPWYWHTEHGGRVSLRTPDRGNLIVMDVVRRGMQGAEPRFAHWQGLFEGAPRERQGGILLPNLNHPDVHLIAAAPLLQKALVDLCRQADSLTGRWPELVSAIAQADLAIRCSRIKS